MSSLSQRVVDSYNAEFGTVETAGDFFVVRLSDGAFFSTHVFEQIRAHDQTQNGAQRASLWLHDRRRRHYGGGLCFKPTTIDIELRPTVGSRVAFNLWRGWPINPAPGNVQPFLDFVLEIICAGDAKLFEYVVAWLADLVQFRDRSGTALVLRGRQGIGKSFFMETLCAMLDQYGIEVNDPTQLIGRFNEHLSYRLLVCADEAAFTDRRAASKLKSLITSSRIAVEPKGRKIIQIENHARFIFAGNHERLIHADGDERRYVVIDVSPKRQNDSAYFGTLAEWRRNGGIAALLDYLQKYRHSVDLRIVPKTKALTEHKLESLSPIGNWWFDKLSTGRLIGARAWEEPHGTQELSEDFLFASGWARGKSTETKFGAQLKKLVPRLRRVRLTKGESQIWAYQFPSLAECREAFEQHLGTSIDWPEEAPEGGAGQATKEGD